MADSTSILWTDHTFNPWRGCVKVSPACDHCYAEALTKRTGLAVWGKGTPRMDECPHGSDAATCPPCRRDAQPEPTVIVTRRFAARFDGQCPGCNLPLAAGADARSVITDGHRVTYHDGCEP